MAGRQENERNADVDFRGQKRSNATQGSAIDGRTTRHAGYAVSQRKRKQIEEPFGWAKTVGYFFSSLLMTAWRQCSSVP